jgi:Undecaprenyl-phosphate galactose phosphotransferase WbaP
VVLLLTDLFSLCLSNTLAILIRSWLNSLTQNPLEALSGYLSLIILNISIVILIFFLMGLYRGYGKVAVVELRSITQTLLIAYIILTFSSYLVGQGSHLSRIVFILSLLFSLILVPLFRFIVYNRFSRLKSWGVPVVVIASLEEIADITSRFMNIQRLGFKPISLLCTTPIPESKHTLKGVPIQPFSHVACEKLISEGVQIAYYSSKDLSDNDPVLTKICSMFPTVYYVLPESNLSSLWVDITDLLGRPALKVEYNLLEKIPNLIKRTVECTLVTFVLLLLSPLLLILALLIYLEDKGPVIYTQDRLGLNGKTIKVIKFRTMMVNAEATLEKYLSENPQAQLEYRKFHKLEMDPRVTKIGGFLRKFSLDEIPQFLNVLRGDMNLVGPRAYMLHELDLDDETTKTILRVRPGVTGWWQVMGRNEKTFADRKKLDLYYITNWSLWLDYYIIIKTFWIILNGKGK